MDERDKKPGLTLSRRPLLQSAAGFMAAAALPSSPASSAQPAAAAQPAADAQPAAEPAQSADVTSRLAQYMVEATTRELPDNVLLECKHRILDTIGAMVSGARLRPGEVALEYVRRLGGTEEASVIGSDFRTTAVNAALANAMCGHADETDDFEPTTKAHPGCVVVPTALAMGEREARSGMDMIKAVALGYDLCCRIIFALGPTHVRATHRSAEGTSSGFGSLGAAAALARLNETEMRYAISYAAQQVSGLWSWVGDNEHIEKAFDFSGMGARNGTSAVTMVQAGFTGILDVLDGRHNMFLALSTEAQPEEMVADLGSRFYVAETAIKTFSVGYPIQSALDGLLTLRSEHNLNADNVQHILLRLPTDGANIVNNSAMADVNLQHLISLALQRGTVTFIDSHDQSLMQDPEILNIRSRVELIADDSLVVPEAPRSAFVEITREDGSKVSLFTPYAPGTKERPLDTAGVSAKVRDLMTPVLGVQKTEALIARVNTLEELDDIRQLRPLLTV